MTPTRHIPEKFKRKKYGITWNPVCDQRGNPQLPMFDARIEIEILRDYDKWARVAGVELMSWEDHFKAFVTLIWARPEVAYKFTWNPYAEEILRQCRQHKFLGVSGHASSGKSQFGAIWAIANFIIDPKKTKVLVTSTSLQESRMRIWGVIEKYWGEAETYFKHFGGLPGKLVSSSGKIVGLTNGKQDDLVGIALIAGGKGNDGESSKIGFKAGKLILIADELPLLTHKIYDAATNLLANDGFQMIGTGNLTSVFDPFGLFTEPERGWDSVNEDMPGWTTKVGGYCIRFDGERSPNVIAQQTLYPGILTQEGLAAIREKWGSRSPGYYRMVKSFPCPTGAIDTIYSEPELTKNLCSHTGTPWLQRPVPIAFLDPAFSKGGDAAAASFALLGPAQIGGHTITVLEKTDTIDLMRLVNARHPTKDRNEQLADLFIAECDKRNVAVPDRGLDATGGGDPFATILAMKMGQGFQLISFAGAASDMIVSATDKRKGKDRFANRVSELWYVGKEFVASGQIRGLDPATMLEMCARTYSERGSKVLVEPKDDMKKRTSGRSPDRADSWVGLIEIARRRHKFLAAAKSARIPSAKPSEHNWFDDPKPKKIGFRDDFAGDFNFSGKNSGWGDSWG
jgi:hypothetical protein